ncbi:hypothetical protein EXS56_00590 [Candidatus Kaiserbacteria bacterium]|nr:hypothetical protein [Candidatus Kaiserbacteria bacterium]
MGKLFSHPRILIGAFFTAIVLLYFAPVFFGRILVQSDYDLFLYLYPVYSFFSNALHTGQSFLWLPEIYSGFPVYLSQTGGFFDPLNLFIFRVFSVLPGMHLRLAIDMLLIFVCSYAAARALGLSRTASMLVGPSYILALDWRYLSNLILPNTLFLLPLLIYCVSLAFRESVIHWRYILLGGIGLGWALLGGFAQLVFYALVLAGFFALGHVFFIEHTRTYAYLARTIGACIALVVVGVVIGLPQILPTAKFLPLTARGASFDYAQATLKSVGPGDVLLTLVPTYFYVPYVTAGRKPLFVGALWFLLACSALIASFATLVRTEKRSTLTLRDRRIVVIGALFLFAFIAALQWSPLYLVLSKLPIFSLFHYPSRFMFLGAFLLSLLGAFGLDSAKEFSKEKIFRYFVYLVAIFTMLFVGALAAIQSLGVTGSAWLSGVLHRIFAVTLQGRFGFHKDPAQYRDAFERGIAAYQELLSFSDPAIFIPLVLLVAAAAMMVLLVRDKLSADRFRLIGAWLTILTVLSMGVLGWQTFDTPRASGNASNVLAPLISAADVIRYRMYSFLPEYAARDYISPQYKLSSAESRGIAELLTAGAAPNLNVWSGLQSVDGYDQFEPTETLAAMSRAGGELKADYGDATPDERRQSLLLNLDILSMMSGKYIVSGMPLQSPSLRLLATSSVTSYGMTLYTYVNPKALPIFYLAQKIVAVPHKNFTDLAPHENLKWGDVTYLDCGSCAQTFGGENLALTEERNGEYDFTVVADSPQYLVLSETNVPGWHASLDGQEVPIIRANGLYMAVLVPKGSHTVRFIYTGILNELLLLQMLGIVHR